jgi:hypothetical protein
MINAKKRLIWGIAVAVLAPVLAVTHPEDQKNSHPIAKGQKTAIQINGVFRF